MRKTIIMVILAAAVMLAGCSDLFRTIKDSNLKTGNDKISSNQGTGGLNLDAGLVVQTPNDPNHLENRINFDPDTKEYTVNGLGTEDSPIKFVCRPEDPNAVVTWEFWRIEDEAGNILPNPVRIYPESVEMTDDGSVVMLTSANDPGGYLYGKVRAIATITADDPQYSTSYTIDLNRTDTLSSAIEILDITPGNDNPDQAAITQLTQDRPFDPLHSEYRIDADEDADYLDIDLQTYDGATVRWAIEDKDGVGVASGTNEPFRVDNLGEGYYKVSITVTEPGKPSRTYVLNVFRPSDDLTTLKGMEFDPAEGFSNGVGALSPAIEPALMDGGDYTVKLSSYDSKDITQLDVNPVTGHKYATVVYSIESEDHAGATIDPNTGLITGLQDGTTRVKMEVHAKDGITVNDHFINIVKAPENSTDLHSFIVDVDGQVSNDLTEINKTMTVVGDSFFDSAYFSPHTSSITTEHGTYLLKQETTDADVTVITFNEGATVTASSDTAATVNSGAGGMFSVAGLPDGATTVTFTVTAKDGLAADTFTLKFNKPLNTNGKIRQMHITQGFLNANPYPASVSQNQTIYVNADTDQLDLVIDRFVHDSAVIIGCSAEKTHEVDGTVIGSPPPVNTSFNAGNSSAVFGGTGADALPAGTTEVTLTTQNGTGPVETYTIVIVKPAVTETRLKAFGANGTFSGFDRDLDYSNDGHTYIKTIENPASVTFFADAIHADSDITLKVSNSDTGFSRTIPDKGYVSTVLTDPETSETPYVVLAEVVDGSGTRTYRGEVTISKPRVNTLSSLSVEHGTGPDTRDRILNPSPFDSGTYVYDVTANVSLGYGRSIRVYPVTTDPLAVPFVNVGSITAAGSFDTDDAEWNPSTRELTIESYADAQVITVPIVVTPQSGAVDNQTYTLHINVPELVDASNDQSVQSLTVHGVTNNYTVIKPTDNNNIAFRFGSSLEAGHGVPQNNGGLDIVGKKAGEADWCGLTYKSGGWHYKVKSGDGEAWVDLAAGYNNGDLQNVSGTGDLADLQFGVEVKVYYVDGMPYAEIIHKVKNNGASTVNDVQIGASFDIQINGNDNRRPIKTAYGFEMAEGNYEFGLYCRNPEWAEQSVSTFWAGQFGYEHDNVFEDNTSEMNIGEPAGSTDPAAAYSWDIGPMPAGSETSRTIRISLGLLGE